MWGSQAVSQQIPACPRLGPTFARVFHWWLSPGLVLVTGTGRALTQDTRGWEATTGPRPSGLLPRPAGSGLPRLISEPLANIQGVDSAEPPPLHTVALDRAIPAQDTAIPARPQRSHPEAEPEEGGAGLRWREGFTPPPPRPLLRISQ